MLPILNVISALCLDKSLEASLRFPSAADLFLFVTRIFPPLESYSAICPSDASCVFSAVKGKLTGRHKRNSEYTRLLFSLLLARAALFHLAENVCFLDV
jgi:hypothetical protein